MTLAEIFWPVPTSCGGQMSVGSHFTVHTASSFGTFSHIDDSEVKLLDGTLSTPDKIPFGRKYSHIATLESDAYDPFACWSSIWTVTFW